MTIRFVIPFVLVGAVAGGLGFLAGRSGTGSALDGPAWAAGHDAGLLLARGPSKADRPETGSLLTPELRRILGDSMPSDADIGAVTYRALEEKDPTRRAVALTLLLESMTPANAVAIKQAFLDSTSRTGRQHHTEWHLMIRQFGKIMGGAAVTDILKNQNDQSLALEGWAMNDPKGARQYVDTLDRTNSEYVKFRSALLNGIMQTDPQQAFQLALADPRTPVISQWLIESAIQSAGMDGAKAAFQQAMDQAGTDIAQSFPFRQIFQSLTDSMFHQNFIAGQSEKMLPWLEQQKDQPYITGDMIGHGAKDVILQGKLPEALDWLDRMNVGRETAPLGVESMMQILAQQPGLLADAPVAMLDRVVAMAPSKTHMTELLAEALKTVSPAHAERLRALASNPTRFDPPQTFPR